MGFEVKRRQVVCIMGPTASGKTALGLALARSLPIEIISVDSAMVYRGLDIGSAKPSSEELDAVPHHLIDVVNPDQIYSAAHFQNDAKKLVQEVLDRGNIPVMLGGTMLYFKALLMGLDDLPNADANVRERIKQRASLEGWSSLHNGLVEVDPEAGGRIHPNDQQRIMRALEVYMITGTPISQLQASEQSQGAELGSELACHVYAISAPDRKVLHERINDRFDQMLEQGLVEEVRQLMQLYELDSQLPSMKSIGYRQVLSYLRGGDSYEMMVEKAKAASRQLAKRQLTWLRGWHTQKQLDIHWLENDTNRSCDLIKSRLSGF